MGFNLSERYSLTGDFADLETGITLFQQAINLIHENSPDLPVCLGNLGKTLRKRHSYTGNPADLEASTEAFQKAVTLTPDTSPTLPEYLNNLGFK